jgi:hypothetical protein
MQEGKGRELLLQALPGLVNYAQVYLLGTGKAGEEFLVFLVLMSCWNMSRMNSRTC